MFSEKFAILLVNIGLHPTSQLGDLPRLTAIGPYTSQAQHGRGVGFEGSSRLPSLKNTRPPEPDQDRETSANKQKATKRARESYVFQSYSRHLHRLPHRDGRRRRLCLLLHPQLHRLYSRRTQSRRLCDRAFRRRFRHERLAADGTSRRRFPLWRFSKLDRYRAYSGFMAQLAICRCTTARLYRKSA